MSKYIFITGGVISSLGKGILSSSVGILLKEQGYNVTIQKIDPYLNSDSGTLSPYEHGECYVTEDGVETDLDLGNYERFLDIRTSKKNIVTGGNVYRQIIENERQGKYLGKTVQIVPHLTDEIKRRFRCFDDRNEDNIIIIEIGGTVGDFESLPFIEALRQLKLELETEDFLFLHLTFVPYINPSGELKTKPTQHSIRQLLSLGIQPDIVICRSQNNITKEVKRKIAFFSNISSENVLEMIDVDLIYRIPILLFEQGLLDNIIKKVKLDIIPRRDSLLSWKNLIDSIKFFTKVVKIAIIGKYSKLQDSYLSIKEALFHAASFYQVRCEIILIDSEWSLEASLSKLTNVHGILVAPGFGARGINGKIAIIKYARENKIPFLGICLGMHCAIIEYARNVLYIDGSNSTEFDSATNDPVIIACKLSSKANLTYNSSMNLGSHELSILENTQAYRAYNQSKIHERFRHKYHFNVKYKTQFELQGMVFSGHENRSGNISIIELKQDIHPCFIGVQFHAEFNSFFLKPHGLFLFFIKNAISSMS